MKPEKKSTKRDQILRTAWGLFESQGYHATGINQIIAESGVPKGSFYHYFPEGKEGLALEAIDAIANGMCRRMQRIRSDEVDVVDGVVCMVREIAQKLDETEYRHGGPLTIVTLETATTNERINVACQKAYNKLHAELVKQLTSGQFTEDDARELATTIIACLEGGILLSRTFHSTDPMEQMARQLDVLLNGRRSAISQNIE
jgi:TetR/AcrR family transcriptional regulator, lmrAB and yxaGH operons repressor